jgi:HEAT repeat protein
MAPAEERLAAIARLQVMWARADAATALRRPRQVPTLVDNAAFLAVMAMGGGAGVIPAAENDAATIDELVALGRDALPALVKGLKFPPGFAAKRASILTACGRLGEPGLAPFVAAVLRDPVFGVAAYAAQALETCGDDECLPALRRFEARLRTAAATSALPASIPSIDPLLAIAARTRLRLGDDDARGDLVNLLLSDDASARAAAIGTLTQHFGDPRGYDPNGSPGERLEAATRWQQ